MKLQLKIPKTAGTALLLILFFVFATPSSFSQDMSGGADKGEHSYSKHEKNLARYEASINFARQEVKETRDKLKQCNDAKERRALKRLLEAKLRNEKYLTRVLNDEKRHVLFEHPEHADLALDTYSHTSRMKRQRSGKKASAADGLLDSGERLTNLNEQFKNKTGPQESDYEERVVRIKMPDGSIVKKKVMRKREVGWTDKIRAFFKSE